MEQQQYKGEEMNRLFNLKYIQPFTGKNVVKATGSTNQKPAKAQEKQQKQQKPAAKAKAEKAVPSYLGAESKYKGMTYEQIMKIKLDSESPLSQAYLPKEVEQHWQKWWEENQFFTANPQNVLNGTKKPYTMVLPPPNVTGMLHIGHGLTSAVEDAIIRRKRMQGYETLYLPGQDHAGIATHTVVEKHLMKTEGKTRHDLGREKFVEKIYEWKEKNGSQIMQQLRLLASSLDWSRFHFTMDDQLSKAVKEAFIQFYDQGLIYRANRLVNWSCKLKTAISDIEVEYLTFDKPTKIQVPDHDGWYTFGELIHFCYQLKEDPSKTIEVATTRIETMLGDSGIAVNSKDPRYKEFHGKVFSHPFFPDREIPIVIDDELVDMEYGTGAVKITPAHDPNDYNCGTKHGLKFINILDDNGLINHNGGKYQGMKRFDLRKQIEIDLKELGLLRGKTPNPMSIGICSRSKDIIEPLLRPQWYMKNNVAERMVEAVKNEEMIIEPAEFRKEWEKWLTNTRDWCISRQLWWGHRIPAFLVEVKGSGKKPDYNLGEDWVIAKDEEEAKEKAAKKYNTTKDNIILTQDEDVLDTWFSSGLFPFSTMGWPDVNTDDFKAFFPNQILETGHDILFFWVARMVQMSLLLTGKLPFKDVYLHPIIRDADGKKMSKSSGNVIDPREIIDGCTLETMIQKLKEGNLPDKEVARCTKNHKENYPQGIPECGSDSLRFSLLAYMQKNRFINLDLKRIIGYRESGNKVKQKQICITKFQYFQKKKNRFSNHSNLVYYIFLKITNMYLINIKLLNYLSQTDGFYIFSTKIQKKLMIILKVQILEMLPLNSCISGNMTSVMYTLKLVNLFQAPKIKKNIFITNKPQIHQLPVQIMESDFYTLQCLSQPKNYTKNYPNSKEKIELQPKLLTLNLEKIEYVKVLNKISKLYQIQVKLQDKFVLNQIYLLKSILKHISLLLLNKLLKLLFKMPLQLLNQPKLKLLNQQKIKAVFLKVVLKPLLMVMLLQVLQQKNTLKLMTKLKDYRKKLVNYKNNKLPLKRKKLYPLMLPKYLKILNNKMKLIQQNYQNKSLFYKLLKKKLKIYEISENNIYNIIKFIQLYKQLINISLQNCIQLQNLQLYVYNTINVLSINY